jgi:hypothetical protein
MLANFRALYAHNLLFTTKPARTVSNPMKLKKTTAAPANTPWTP